MEQGLMAAIPAYRRHLQSSADLVTSYEATRAGFVAFALERNRRASPLVDEARALQEAASSVGSPADLIEEKSIETALLTAAGLSDKALRHLEPEDKRDAIANLVENFLMPAGEKFIEELVFRFLLTRGDALGGSMRNAAGALAQRRLTRAILSWLKIAGIRYSWLHSGTRQWADATADDSEIEWSLRGIAWAGDSGSRTLQYNLLVPLVGHNVDFCLFSLDPPALLESRYREPRSYVAVGELKGGIDPAGADEHWKTARAALDRVRTAFAKLDHVPHSFFVGAAIERTMADEIWEQLQGGVLSNAANLNDDRQVASLARWLCTL
jgi:hypothetical protein